MRLLPGLVSPLANRTAADIDMVCVRENSEGEYAGLGGRVHVGTPYEVAEQTGLFTRNGIERILRYGFEIASKRPRRLLASATKSNALRHAMVLWDEVAESVAKDYPAVEYRKYHVDAIAARMVTHPAHARRHRRVEPVRRHPHRHRLGDLGQPGHRAGREHQPRADFPVDVRADSRLGAGHRRQGHRQPDRRDLGRRDDARPSRPPRRARSHSRARSSGSSPPGRTARPTSAARPRRSSWRMRSARKSDREVCMPCRPARSPQTVSEPSTHVTA